jgi:hypothetical protein
MEELKPDNNPPNFGSLSEIMERFGHVPYEQFQKDLNDWFITGLKENGVSIADLEKQGYPDLSTLISSIYHKAEVLQTLADLKIKPDHESK